jgi:predicted outer membrane repeat protein
MSVSLEAVMICERCTFDSNVADDEAAAVILFSAAQAKFKDCLFVNNRAEQNGGSLFAYKDTIVSIDACTFRNNSAFK